MLDNAVLSQFSHYMERLVAPVEIVASLDDSKESTELQFFLKQLVEHSNQRIAYRETALSRTPSFGIALHQQTPRVFFAGIPAGHEFTSLVLALLHVSGYAPKMDDALRDAIVHLDQDMRFEVYISLSCHNCPDVVQAVNTMAALNPRVQATMIDGAWNQEEVETRQVMAVPSLFMNGELVYAGRIDVEGILSKVDRHASSRKADLLNLKEAFDVLVVGGGPAGVSSAVYAARKGIRVGIIADRIGGQTNDTMGIENYTSVVETNGPKFATDLLAHAKHYQVDLMLSESVTRVERHESLFHVTSSSGGVLRAKTVIVATGARWRNLNVPGEQEYKNKGVAYCPHCDGPLFKGKRVAVVGGGNSGVEAAIDLAGIVSHVTILEYSNVLKADKVLVDKLESLPNVTIVKNAKTLRVEGDGQKVQGLVYMDQLSNQESTLELEGIFVQIGLVPNTEFVRDTVECTSWGEIVVDAHCKTSVPGLFAAGDATTVPFKQIVVAAGEGAKAALGAFDYLIRNT